ncbi:ATP-binding cassette domain-containing protein [Natronococcus sp.]|uniref:ABC transporter ATP-binding protein n=1 Tax=Natronococcus sp. TaxID=35747 RepID=UPI003A4E2C1B
MIGYLPRLERFLRSEPATTGRDETDAANDADIGSRSRAERVDGADDAGSSEPNEPSSFVGEELELSYPATEEPVAEVDRIDLPAGEVTALVGPNGSGKSTLLKALARQLEPDAGGVYLDGTDVESLGTKAFARRVGLLSQENESPGGIAVEELIYYGRYPHRDFFDSVGAEDRAAVERAISLTGIDHLREESVDNLSGGQKQLVWVAMILAQETDVLLLDEPTTYLDLHHQLRVLDVVATVGYGEEGPTIVPHRPLEE